MEFLNVPDGRRFSIRMVADMMTTIEGTLRKNVHYELNMRKLFANMVTENLTLAQKVNWMNICYDIAERLPEEPNLLRNIITCDVI